LTRTGAAACSSEKEPGGNVQIERLFLALLGGLFLVAPAAPPARAQDYPTRPITIVVPFTPGGTTDILARMIGQRLEARLGQSFLIENKPGAGSVIGANAVAKAVPDGYTLLMATSTSMAVDVTLYKNLPYNPASDLIPLALVARTPFVLVVNPSLPVRSVQDLIKLAKDRPGQLSYASAGPGTPHHLYAELLKRMTGIEMAHVPYRGSQPSLNDVVAGHVQLMFVDVAPAVGMLRAGKIRPLGVSTGKRLAAFPEIPPLAEAGVPGFDVASWQMIAAPAKTPRPILDKLHGEAKSIVALQEVKDRIIAEGMLPIDNPSIAELQDFVKSEIVRWSKVVQQAGIAGSQ
jgi:tripartite-type tricarboxylate transporter receptor subunit TctC